MKKVTKRQSSKARLEKFINERLASGMREIEQIVADSQAKVLTLMNKLTDEALKAVGGTIKSRRAIKVGKTEKISPIAKKTLNVDGKKPSGEKIFLAGLENMGRPAMTFEIGNRLRKVNPDAKKFARNKKDFMQMLYNSASSLSKAGLIVRKPVGKRTFEYSLKEWGNADKVAVKTTAKGKKTKPTKKVAVAA